MRRRSHITWSPEWCRSFRSAPMASFGPGGRRLLWLLSEPLFWIQSDLLAVHFDGLHPARAGSSGHGAGRSGHGAGRSGHGAAAVAL
jgi:hypothetical protein